GWRLQSRAEKAEFHHLSAVRTERIAFRAAVPDSSWKVPLLNKPRSGWLYKNKKPASQTCLLYIQYLYITTILCTMAKVVQLFFRQGLFYGRDCDHRRRHGWAQCVTSAGGRRTPGHTV